MVTYYCEQPARSTAWLLNHKARGKCLWLVEETPAGDLCIAKWVYGARVGYYEGA